MRIPRIDLDDLLGLKQARVVWRMFMLCALVGVIAGLGAAAFYALLDLSSHLFLDELAGYRPAGPGGEPPLFVRGEQPFSRWILFVLPAAGGLVSGALVYFFAPEAEGHGTDAAIDAYHHKAGHIRARVPIVKTLASAITIGTGGSAGREGPIAQIGAGFGSILGTWLNLSQRERRIMMAAGLGAGVGAIFHAPLAGALFSAEVLYREMDLEYEIITPSILASIVAYSVFSLIFGWEPLFVTPAFSFHNPAELLPYTGLALVVAIGGILFVKLFYGVRDLFQRLRVPNHVKPAIGGLVVGTVGFWIPEALSSGYGVVQGAFTQNVGVGLLFAVVAAKMVTTSFTIGSGGSGGVFGPSVVIGGALGGGVGLIFAQWMPSLVSQPGSYAMIGMAGFFAAVANTPLSTVIMVSEMTGNYHLLVPSMWVCVISFLLVRRNSIYEKQVSTRSDAPAHLREMTRAVLERLRVADALALREQPAPPIVHERTVLHDVLEAFSDTEHSCMPVVNETGELRGCIHLAAVQKTLGDESALDPVLIAQDLAESAYVTTPQATLFDALQQMITRRHSELLVIEDADTRIVQDILTSADINAAYNSQLDLADAPTTAPFADSVFLKRLFRRDHHHR